MQGRFGKIVLVVLGVVLMIMFILPAGLQNMAGSDPVVGTLDGEQVRPSELQNVHRLYLAGSRIQVPAGGRVIPLAEYLFGPYAAKLADEPLLWYLLVREAERNGVGVPLPDVENNLTRINARIFIDDPSSPDRRRLVAFEDLAGEQIRQNAIYSAAALFNVYQSMEHFADFTRISDPVVDYFVALQGQQVDLRTVVFNADAFLDRVPEPDEQAMQAHFQAHRDQLKGSVTQENPFGFGYRLPDRIKFQYLRIPHDAVRSRVLTQLAEMPLPQREQTLYPYWRENRALYPVPPEPRELPPIDEQAEPPTGQAALLAEHNPQVRQFLESQTEQVAGQPIEADWRAFVAVHDEVVRGYLDAQTEELESRVTRRIREILASDFRAYDLRQAAGARAGDEPPATRVGVPVDDLTYFERVADHVAQELGIRPDVVSYARDFVEPDELNDRAEVGPIAEAVFIGQSGPTPTFLPFSAYALGAALPLLEEEQRQQVDRSGMGLNLFQPSQTLSDMEGSDYIFRLVDAARSEPPASLAAVEEQVRRDLRRKAAFEMALQEAQAFAEQARQSSLEEAAGPAPMGRRIHEPGPFVPGAGPTNLTAFGAEEIGENALTVPARMELAQGIFNLLNETADEPHDIGVVPIRPAFRVIVAEVMGLEAMWTSTESLAMERENIRRQLQQNYLRTANPYEDFFDLASARTRTSYEERGQ